MRFCRYCADDTNKYKNVQTTQITIKMGKYSRFYVGVRVLRLGFLLLKFEPNMPLMTEVTTTGGDTPQFRFNEEGDPECI